VMIVGLNWDRLSGATARPAPPRQDISPASLEDAVGPLASRVPGYQNGRRAREDHLWLQYLDMPLNLTDTFSWTYHVVASGETVSGIAARNSLSQDSLIALNDIRETWNLQAGRALRIPNMDGIPYTVGEGDTLGAIAQRMGVPLNVLLDANSIESDSIAPGQVLFVPGGRMDAGELRRAIFRPPSRPLIRPVPGRITSGFGWREDPFQPGSGRMQLHRAIDLSGNMGDPVRAAMSGTVVYTGFSTLYGNMMVLQHEGNRQTLYAHLSSFSAALGQTVTQGQIIARVGATGRATGPHLHFALFYRGEPVNPVDLWR